MDLSFAIAGVVLFFYVSAANFEGAFAVDGGVHFTCMHFGENDAGFAVDVEGEFAGVDGAFAELGFFSAEGEKFE